MLQGEDAGINIEIGSSLATAGHVIHVKVARSDATGDSLVAVVRRLILVRPHAIYLFRGFEIISG